MKLNKFILLDADPANNPPSGGEPPQQSQKMSPVKFREPTAEELKGEFKVDDSDSEFFPEPTTEELKKKEEPAAQQPEHEEPEVKQPEVKQPPAKQEKVEQPPVEKKEPEVTKPNLLQKLNEKKAEGTRDYTGFSEDQVKVLKNMSKESFEYVAPILKQQKELEKLKTATYLQHPNAYVLSPEFQQNQQLAYKAQREAAVWEEQLLKMRKGEEWTPPVGIDKDGNFIYGDKRPASLQDEEQVRLALSKCLQAKQSAETNLAQLPHQFQQTMQQDLQVINQERARRFDWVADPKLLEHELDVEGVGKQKISDIKNHFQSMFPVYLRHTPGVEVAADLFVSMIIYKQQLALAEGNRQVAETLKEEATRVEPSSSLRTASRKAADGVTEFDLSGMPT